MEDLFKVDKQKVAQDEDGNFSLIEVYPYLHYGNSGQERELDFSKIFQFSLNRRVSVLDIHVRSLEAQEEVFSYLIGKGFDNIKKKKGTIECINKKDKDGELIDNPRTRRYFDENRIDYTEISVSNSDLVVQVKFEMKKLGYFKKVIKELRKDKQYRNKWVTGDNNYIIK